MTVALVLATATACDRAPRRASSAAQGGQAVGSRGADAHAGRSYRDAVPPPRTGGSTSGRASSRPSTSGHANRPRPASGSAGSGGSAPTPASGAVGQPAACLPLPSLAGGQVTTQPLLTRLCRQLCELGVRDIILISPVGCGDVLTAMAWDGLALAGPGLAAVGNVDAIECASIAAELRAVAAVTRRVKGSGEAVLICGGDLVAHTEVLARLQRGMRTAALTAADTSVRAASGPDMRPALRLSGGGGAGRGADAQGARRGSAWAGPGGRGPADGTGAGFSVRRAVVAAGSAFHRVHAPDAVGCGAFLVAADDGDQLAAAADELADLAAGDLTDDRAAADPARDRAVGSAGSLAAGPASHLLPGLSADVRGRLNQGMDDGHLSQVSADSRNVVAVPPRNVNVQAARATNHETAGERDNVLGAHADGGVTASQGPHGSRGVSRSRSGFTDSVALLLVGLVRSGTDVEAVDVSPLVCVRVQTAEQARAAAAELNAVAEDRIRLRAAVNRGDGVFATCFVSPYSRHLARWAARRQVSPNAVTGMSIGLGVLAAVWFSAGSSAGTILGAALLFAAFLLDRVDGQLASYVRGETRFGTWLAAVGARLTEFAVYAGLAAGAAASRSPSIWELAAAAVIVQSVRDMIGFCVRPAAQDWSAGAPPGRLPLDEPADYAVSAPAATVQVRANVRPGARWLRAQVRRVQLLARHGIWWLARIVEFQPGERIAVIAVTVVAAGPRMTFVVLLAWGLVSACLGIVGLIVRSFHMLNPVVGARDLVTYRDDGTIAQSLGRFVDGQLPPLLPAVVGVAVTVILSGVGVAHLRGLMVFAPIVALALAGLGSGHAHDGRLDWLVPPLLQVGEYVFLTALALAGHVPIPLLFTLVAVIALHHYDIVYRVRRATAAAAGVVRTSSNVSRSAPSATPPQWIAKAGLGWEGRMLAAAFGAMLGVEVFAFVVLAVYLWVLFGWESLTGWMATAQQDYGGPRRGLSAVPHAAARSADVEDGGS